MTNEFEFIFSDLSALEVEDKLRQIIDTGPMSRFSAK